MSIVPKGFSCHLLLLSFLKKYLLIYFVWYDKDKLRGKQRQLYEASRLQAGDGALNLGSSMVV